ncbi:MAG: acyltransferase [Pirellulales bacterium]
MNVNNFDLLRLVLASVVVLVHARVLSNSTELSFLTRWLNSDYAVHGFFVISGFLICRSYEGSHSFWHYCVKRARRLLPGYISVVLLGVLLGLFVTRYSPFEYLSDPATFKYVVFNLSFLNFLQPSLPGVFEANHFGQAVNGSLWSIRTEILCYLLVPLLWQAATWVSLRTAAFASVLLFTFLNMATHWVDNSMSPAMVGMVRLGICECGQCFAVGAVAYSMRDRLQGRGFGYASIICLAMLALGLLDTPWIRLILGPWILGVSVLGVGLAFPYLGNWTRHGDYSYGIYVIHFPVIQLLVSRGMFQFAPGLALFTTVCITLALAALSWHFIELPWLTKGNHYRQSTETPSSVIFSLLERDGDMRSLNATRANLASESGERESNDERRAA